MSSGSLLGPEDRLVGLHDSSSLQRVVMAPVLCCMLTPSPFFVFSPFFCILLVYAPLTRIQTWLRRSDVPGVYVCD